MLQSMGWKAGEGLGKNSQVWNNCARIVSKGQIFVQGITAPVTAVIRPQGTGLGAAPAISAEAVGDSYHAQVLAAAKKRFENL